MDNILPKYNDVKFFLPAIAFISAFNYYLTYNNIQFNGHLLLTYLIDTAEGWLAWWIVRSIIIYLDAKMPYGNKPMKRILVQCFLTTTAGLFIIISLTEIVSVIAKGEMVPTSFYLFDVFIFIIWFLAINGIYAGMHYFSEWKNAENKRSEEKKVRIGGFAIKHGKQNLLIAFEDIYEFYVEDGYSISFTNQHKKHFPDKSLDKIEEILPQEWFFRLNRQFIMHRKSVTGFKRGDDGKIDVLVNAAENFTAAIQVSRTKAAAFKKWFQAEKA